MAHIAIVDTGSGISEANLEKIYDPFFTTKEVGKGTGLGLSMAKGVIEGNGGAINISSTVGVGTKIEICLPLVNAPADRVTQETSIIKASDNETILLVDDEEIVRTTLANILLSLGYCVLVAKDGKDGVRLFQAHADAISLVISDVVMPVLDGPKSVKRMREIKADLPVIFVTGYDKDELDHHFQNEPLTSLISKPFRVAELSHLVHDILKPSQP